MFKVLVILAVLAVSCSQAARVRRQEDGEFWWLKKETPADNKEPEAEVKLNIPDTGKTAALKEGNELPAFKHNPVYFQMTTYRLFVNRERHRFGRSRSNIEQRTGTCWQVFATSGRLCLRALLHV